MRCQVGAARDVSNVEVAYGHRGCFGDALALLSFRVGHSKHVNEGS